MLIKVGVVGGDLFGLEGCCYVIMKDLLLNGAAVSSLREVQYPIQHME